MRPSDQAHHHFVMRFTIFWVIAHSRARSPLYRQNVMRITKW